MILTLPWPPTANHRMTVVRGRMILTSEYRAWKEKAAVMILKERCSLGRRDKIAPPYKVVIEVRPPDQRRRDLDNLLKCSLDALVAAKIIEDDFHINELSIWRDAPIKGGSLRVTVQTIMSPK